MPRQPPNPARPSGSPGRRSIQRPSEPPTESAKAAASAAERKEKVLHTRVPDSLDRQLRHRARNLGMSVSTVVRHVLLNTFGLVEDIVADSTNVALTIAGADGLDVGRRPADRGAVNTPDDADADVIAWHEAVLNRNAVCDRCNAVLRKGSRAAVGLRERPGPQMIRCVKCLRAAGDDSADSSDSKPRKRSPRRRRQRQS